MNLETDFWGWLWWPRDTLQLLCPVPIRGLVNKMRDLAPRREAYGPKCTCACPGSRSTSCSIAGSDLLLFNCIRWRWLSYLTLVAAWTVACQGPLSMGFPRQGYWSGLPIVFSFWNFRCCWEVSKAAGFCDHWGIWHYMYLLLLDNKYPLVPSQKFLLIII